MSHPISRTARLLAGALLIILAGCKAAIDPALKAKVRRVGVTSMIENQVKSIRVGMSIYESESFMAPADEIPANTAAAGLLVNELRRQFPDVSVLGEMDREAFAALPRAGLVKEVPGTLELEPYERAAKEIAGRNQLDLVVLAYSYGSSDPGVPEGLGFQTYGLTYSGRGIVVYTMVRIAIFEGATGKCLFSGLRLGLMPRAKDPHLPGLMWKGAYTNYTPAERAQISAKITQSIRDVLPVYLRRAGL